MKVIQVCSYKSYGHAYADHIRKKGIAAEWFYIEKVPRQRFPSKMDVVRGVFYGFTKMALSFWKFRNVRIYSGGWGGISCMLFTRLFGGILGSESHLYLYNFYLHGLGKNKYVQMALRFMMDNDRLTLMAQTPDEIEFYRRLSKKINLCFVPYCSDLEERHTEVSLTEGYVFTGGYTNRDYQLMLKLAERMPERKFLFVASKMNKGLDKLPPNVELKREVTPSEFGKLMERAAIVVVPLREDVGSSGQMLCIQAMRYHKPVVYTNVSSISYYFSENSGIPYQLGNVDSLQAALASLYDEEGKAREMGENAYKESLKYTSTKCTEQLDRIILGI